MMRPRSPSDGDDGGEDSSSSQVATTTPAKKLKVPGEFIDAMQQHVSPSFATPASKKNAAFFKQAASVISAQGGGVAELQHRIEELQEQLEQVYHDRSLVKSLKKIEDEKRRDAMFMYELGCREAEFDDLFGLEGLAAAIEEGTRHSTIQEGEQKKRRKRTSRRMTPQEKLGMIMRFMCKSETFADTGRALDHDEAAVARTVKAGLKSILPLMEAQLFDPPTPSALWQHTKVYRPRAYSFIKDYVAGFDERNTYVLMRADGTHEIFGQPGSCTLNTLTHCHKWKANTLFTNAVHLGTDEFYFTHDWCLGRTSEKAGVEMCGLLPRVLEWIQAYGDDVHLVLFVDKGYGFIVDWAKQRVNVHAFIPPGQKQASTMTQALLVQGRRQAQVRCPQECAHNVLKRVCARLSPHAQPLMTRGPDTWASSADFKRDQMRFAFCLHNLHRRRRNPEIANLARSGIGSTFLSSSGALADLKLVVASRNLNQSFRTAFAAVPQLTKKHIEDLFETRFRSASTRKRAGNMLRKASDMLLGMRVVGLRFRTLTDSKMLLVIECVSTYGTKCYTTALELNFGNLSLTIDNHLCVCFAGLNVCVHQATAVLLLARHQKVDIPDILGTKGMKYCKSEKLISLDWKILRDTFDFRSAMEAIAEVELVVPVHPKQLEETSWDALKARMLLIRAERHERRARDGKRTIGDILLAESLGNLRVRLEGFHVDVDDHVTQFVEDHGVQPTKVEYRHWVLQCMQERGTTADEKEAARVQLEELDPCPCDSTADDMSEWTDDEKEEIQCPRCRAYMHRKCSQYGVDMDPKHYKECITCTEARKAAATLKKQRKATKGGDKELGFFKNYKTFSFF